MNLELTPRRLIDFVESSPELYEYANPRIVRDLDFFNGVRVEVLLTSGFYGFKNQE